MHRLGLDNQAAGSQVGGMTPTPQEVKSARQALQARLGLNITKTQDHCAGLVHTSRRAWQQWERGDRRMHPAFWELFRIKSGNELEKHNVAF